VIESDVVAKYVALNIDGIDGKGDDLYPSEKSDGGNYKDDAERIELFLESWQKVTDSYYDLLRATSAGEAEKLQKSFLACLSPVEDLLREQKGGGPESGQIFPCRMHRSTMDPTHVHHSTLLSWHRFQKRYFELESMGVYGSVDVSGL
jgi:hypothetical protein